MSNRVENALLFHTWILGGLLAGWFAFGIDGAAVGFFGGLSVALAREVLPKLPRGAGKKGKRAARLFGAIGLGLTATLASLPVSLALIFTGLSLERSGVVLAGLAMLIASGVSAKALKIAGSRGKLSSETKRHAAGKRPADSPWYFVRGIKDPRLDQAKARYDALLAVARDTPNAPETLEIIRILEHSLEELALTWRRASRHALDAEKSVLDEQLIASLVGLAAFADEQRQALLRPIFGDFETAQRYTRARVGLTDPFEPALQATESSSHPLGRLSKIDSVARDLPGRNA